MNRWTSQPLPCLGLAVCSFIAFVAFWSIVGVIESIERQNPYDTTAMRVGGLLMPHLFLLLAIGVSYGIRACLRIISSYRTAPQAWSPLWFLIILGLLCPFPFGLWFLGRFLFVVFWL